MYVHLQDKSGCPLADHAELLSVAARRGGPLDNGPLRFLRQQLSHECANGGESFRIIRILSQSVEICGNQPIKAAAPEPAGARCFDRPSDTSVRTSSLPPEVALSLAPARQDSPWSFGQPRSPQGFLVLGDVFGASIRAQRVFEIGNTKRGVKSP